MKTLTLGFVFMLAACAQETDTKGDTNKPEYLPDVVNTLTPVPCSTCHVNAKEQRNNDFIHPTFELNTLRYELAQYGLVVQR